MAVMRSDDIPNVTLHASDDALRRMRKSKSGPSSRKFIGL